MDPSALGYDSGTNEIFVANGADGTNPVANVTILSDLDNRPVASYSASQVPTAFAFDFARSEMYVTTTDYGVNVIDDSSNARVADIQLAQRNESGATYDSGKQEVFATDGQQVTIISAVTNSIIATVNLASPSGHPTGPLGLVYDRLKGEVFVADSLASNVSVINDTTDTVVATISVGAYPQAIAYDSILGELFVANNASNNVSVISDQSNSVVDSVPVGFSPSGVTWDGQTHEVFVSNWGSNNVTVISEPSDAVIASIPVGAGPSALIFDGIQTAIYVANSGSDSVSVISSATQAVTASTPVSSLPWAVADDPSAGLVFLTNIGDYPDNLSAISDTTNAVVATVAVGDSPKGLAFDSGMDEVFVTDSAEGMVSVVSVAGMSVVTTITVGDVPTGVAYDPARGELFVANEYSFTVSVINDTTNHVVATIPVGANPEGVTCDPFTGEVFVVNDESSNVSVISVASNKVIGTVPVGPNPIGDAFDPDLGAVFVTNIGSDNLTEISVSNLKTPASYPVGSGPYGVAYDSSTGELYVANSGSDNVSVISAVSGSVLQSIPVGSGPVGVACVASLGEAFVANYISGNVSVIGAPTPTDSVTFRSAGLPSGTAWSVMILGGSTYTSVRNDLTFQLSLGTYSFTLSHIPGYLANPSRGMLFLNGSSVVVPVQYGPPKFAVDFFEGVLPAGTQWWANISGQAALVSQTNETATLLPNGSYTYGVAAVVPPDTYAGHGTFRVAGEPLTIKPTFAKSERFTVTFGVTGLPLRTKWWANITYQPVHHTTGTSLSTQLLNGSYSVLVTSQDSKYSVDGSAFRPFQVTGGAVTLDFVFGSGAFNVYFPSTGLPSGTAWNVTMNGLTQGSTNPTISFHEPDGNYPYSISAVAGYSSDPTSGTAVVSGNNVTLPVAYTFTSTLTLGFNLDPNTARVAQIAPATVAFSAWAGGGTPPYTFAWNLGDGSSGKESYLDHTYTKPGTFLATVTVTDSAGVSLSAQEPVRIGTSTYDSAWVPAWDAYSIGNPGSVWSQGGNCYGLSSTAVLYYDRSIASIPFEPYIPDDVTAFPNAVSTLSSVQAPRQNPAGLWNSFDNVTLAIYLHQTAVTNRVSMPWNNAATATAVMAHLISTDEPILISLGPTDYHAVVVYAAQLETNGSIEFAISDPNTGNASFTTNAWFVPPSTFHYHFIYHWSDFGLDPAGPYWENSTVLGKTSSWAVNTLWSGWQLIQADAPVTVTSRGVDSFSDEDGGDSQTFVQGIVGSAGIEEAANGPGAWQAYLLPPGSPAAMVDPGSSTLVRMTYGANVSGSRALEAIQVQVNADQASDYSIARTNEGFALATGGSPASVNLSVGYETDTHWYTLNATDIALGAETSAQLAVSDWTGLNSSSTPSATITIGGIGSSAPNRTYALTNGQQGISASSSGKSPSDRLLGLPVDEVLALVGLLIGLVVVAAVVVVRRNRPSEPPKTR